MRILFVSLSFPDDPAKVHGVFRRLDLLIAGLAGLGKLDLLFFVDETVDVSSDAVERFRRELAERWAADFELTLARRRPADDDPGRWEAYGAPVFDAFRQPGFRGAAAPAQRQVFEAAIDRRPDIVFAHRLAAMAPILRTGRPLPPVVFDLDDIEHRSLARAIPQPPVWRGKYLTYLQVPALWWAERRAMSAAKHTFVCSVADRDYIQRTMRVGGITEIPNAVEIRGPTPLPSQPTALFLGSLVYPPNRNAAVYLMREVWPRVRRRVPEARLIIAGPNPDSVPGSDEPPAGVEFRGFVKELDPLYAGTRVVCAPIFAGGGTRVKIIEAAAFGRPVVATTIGAEGLAMEDGREILLRDDPEAFADAVADLMRDDERARRIGEAGRAAVARTYDRDRIVERIRTVVASCAETVSRPASPRARRPARRPSG